MVLNYQNGTCIMRRVILNNTELKSHGFFFMTELLIKQIKLRYLYAEVPVKLKRRKLGKSKAISINSLCKTIFGYFRMIFYVYFRVNKKEKYINECITYKRINEE